MSMLVPPPRRCTTIGADGQDALALRRAADVLAYARHPGVPELVAARSVGQRTELDLGVPDSVPLRTLALALEEVAGVVATVATTVADLHDIGVAIGAIGIDGVVVTPDGQAVVTDFTRAARLPGSPPDWAGHALVRRDDRDVGRLLSDLIDRCAPSAVSNVLEARRFKRMRGRHGGPLVTARSLAERAATGGLTSRRLSERLATDIPGARLPDRASAGVGGFLPSDGAATAAVGARAIQTDDGVSAGDKVGVDASLDDSWAMTSGDAGAAQDKAFDRWFGNAPGSPAFAECNEGSSRQPRQRRRLTTRWATAAGCVPAMLAGIAIGEPWAASSPPPCARAASGCVTYRAGVLSVNGTRYAVGRPGDVVAVGHWWCSGPSVALLRPATGEVWLYAAWPSGGAATAPALGTTVPGARTLTVASKGGCDALTVQRSGGSPARIVVPALP